MSPHHLLKSVKGQKRDPMWGNYEKKDLVIDHDYR